MRRTGWTAAVAVLSLSLTFTSCNLTGGIDDANSREDKIKDAQAKMEQNQCNEAVTALDSISDKDDRIYQLLGFAHLCRAGATVEKTMSTLFSFNSTTNNFTIVGSLANSLIPSDSTKVDKVGQAVTAFTSMSAGNERQLWLAFSNIVKASAIIAKSSGNGVTVKKADVAAAGCASQTCSTGGTCTPASSGSMTAQDATDVGNAISAANTAVGNTTGLGIGRDLPANLSGQFNNISLATNIRCVVHNQMLAE